MIGETIRRLREENDMTQEQLAKMINLSQQTIDHYEKGRAKPNIDTVKLLANIFGVTTDFLLGQTDAQTPSKSALSLLFAKFIKLMKDQRGAMPSENALQLLTEMVQFYAVSKGIPPSVLANQVSQAADLSDEEKARLANEIDGILQEESYSANELAEEIESLPEKERQAMEAMLDVLKNRNNDAAAQES